MHMHAHSHAHPSFIFIHSFLCTWTLAQTRTDKHGCTHRLHSGPPPLGCLSTALPVPCAFLCKKVTLTSTYLNENNMQETGPNLYHRVIVIHSNWLGTVTAVMVVALLRHFAGSVYTSTSRVAIQGIIICKGPLTIWLADYLKKHLFQQPLKM